MAKKKDELSASGYIPAIHVIGENLPEAWEKTTIGVWENGVDVRTEYDQRDKDTNEFLFPPSKDATVMVEVKNPFAEPRIHKNFPGGPEELEVYRQEVLDGIHDHWVDPTDPDKWTYTYHQRIFAYQPTTNVDDPKAILKEARNGDIIDVTPVNQLENVINGLSRSHYSRRVQAITWMPTADNKTPDPPCLQRLWFRILVDPQGVHWLNMNSHWRSRDEYKAWFMNAFALTDLQRIVAEGISKQTGEEIRVGRYVDISDSLHIYGSYFKDVEKEVAKMKANPDYRTRAWNSNDEAIQFMFEDTRRRLREDPDYMKSK